MSAKSSKHPEATGRIAGPSATNEDPRDAVRMMAAAQAVGLLGSWYTRRNDGDARHWSPEALRILGVDVAAWDGRAGSLLALVHPDEREAVRRVYEDSVSGRSAFNVDYRLQRGDGAVVWIRERAQPLDDERSPIGMVGVVQDVTEARRLEEALRDSEDRLRRSNDHLARAQRIVTLGSGELNLSTGEVFWSDELFRMLGLDPQVARPSVETFLTVVHPEDRTEALAIARRMREGVDIAPVEFRIVAPDGSVRWFYRMTDVVRDSRGVATNVMSTLLDITDRKRAELDVVRAKEEAERANAAKTQLLSAVSHDFRQPLQAILMPLDFIASRLPDERSRRILARAESAARRLARSLDGLLEVSKLDSGRRRPRLEVFRVQDVVDEVIELFAEEAREKALVLDSAEADCWVHSDREILGIILQNLVDNAIKYTQTGRVWVECRPLGQGDRASVTIEVHDTGTGIPAHKLPSIFEEARGLAPERGEGLGLGLSIVKRSADLLGYPIEVESDAGRGACFRVAVPLTAAAVPGAARPR